MYAYIKGIITEISDSSITVEAGGIGYEVYVSAYSASFFQKLYSNLMIYFQRLMYKIGQNRQLQA